MKLPIQALGPRDSKWLFDADMVKLHDSEQGLADDVADAIVRAVNQEHQLAAAREATFGCALACRVLQSDLYAKLSDVERAECDEFIERWKALRAPQEGER